MISFDLRCGLDHVFEGWFRSSADYEAQRTGGMIACPVCGNVTINKAVMAPAVAAKGNRRVARSPAGPQTSHERAPATLGAAAGQFTNAEQARAMLSALAEAQAKMLEQSQWVGDAFAEKARAMHYGETEQAQIHGTANAQEARAMIEEGIAVAPLLVPTTPPDHIQ